MTNGHIEMAEAPHGEQSPMAVASLAVGAAFFTLWFPPSFPGKEMPLASSARSTYSHS
jgi:hypothetical protein